MRTLILACGLIVLTATFGLSEPATASVPSENLPTVQAIKPPVLFDIPMAYNSDVRKWIRYFQGRGRDHFKKWLERSHRVLPQMQQILVSEGLPRDLAYMSMIESGFFPHAKSHASAVGPWQFMKPTGQQYGLRVSWWIDERRDFEKSTRAAARYLKFLYSVFKAWHLVAAGYNAGENYVLRKLTRHRTDNFWILSARGGLYDETREYVPKLLAATLISKAPSLYGFRNLQLEPQIDYDTFMAPGGSDLKRLADFLGVTHQHLLDLNPDLLVAYIPESVRQHRIRIPKGSLAMVASYFRKTIASNP